MKLKDIIANLSKDSPERDLDTIAYAVGFDSFDFDYEKAENDGRLVYYWIMAWYCTDSYVGLRGYYLDNELVAVSEQQGRKYKEKFNWTSKDAFIKVKNYIKSFETIQDEDIDLLNEEEEFPDGGYTVDFRNSLLRYHKFGTYEGRKVEIVWPQPKSDNYIDKTVVLIDNGECKTVPVNDVIFPYGVKSQ